MNQPRRTRRSDSAKALRAQRGAAAVVAQYIHELSGRHGGRRSGVLALPVQLRTGTGAVQTAPSRGAC